MARTYTKKVKTWSEARKTTLILARKTLERQQTGTQETRKPKEQQEYELAMQKNNQRYWNKKKNTRAEEREGEQRSRLQEANKECKALLLTLEKSQNETLEARENIRILQEHVAENLRARQSLQREKGALGSWRLGQRFRPSETINKFNCSFVTCRNDTEVFHEAKLNTEEDEAYLRRTARHKDRQKSQKQIKQAQMAADAERAAENVAAQARAQAKKDKKTAGINEAGKSLKLTVEAIQGLTVPMLNQQLDWHRENEKNFPSLTERVPLTSHMGNKGDRIKHLKNAVDRYLTAISTAVPPMAVELAFGGVEVTGDVDQGDPLYESDHEDNMI
ncbi:hypothetical protein CPC08DRAFT_775425 [Agrocybe pediades]|nr:hypothetical protein CPC08DRAFT_775425 [Agrocybe pediades]